MGYDIIGDVHGCAKTLELLLIKLGYENIAPDAKWPIYKHSRRMAIFLGDVVDRGPRIREALHLVKGMVEAGTAYCIVGNHEINALSYTTKAPEGSGHIYVREHNARHNRIIAETLNQFASYPEEWRMFLDWFQTLPVFMEFEQFRVVHACWDNELISAYIGTHGADRFVSKGFIQASSIPGSFAARFLNRLTRGTDLNLPEGRKITGQDGFERRAFRTKFWADSPETFQDVAFQPDPLPHDLSKMPLSREQKESLLSYDESEKPVFVGHYWLQGEPEPLRKNIACLDYSAVKYGRLVCYRYDGEESLQKEKFEWVVVTPDINAG